MPQPKSRAKPLNGHKLRFEPPSQPEGEKSEVLITVSGPPGTGKTQIVSMISDLLRYHKIEFGPLTMSDRPSVADCDSLAKRVKVVFEVTHLKG